MKKKWVIVFIVIILLCIPFVGNKVIQETIDKRLEQLSYDGLSVKLLSEKQSYLKTTLQYNITVANEKKFIQYLQRYSKKQLPPYTQSLLRGVEFGVIVTYNNIPLSDKIEIDIFPSRLPAKFVQRLKKNSPNVHKKIMEILGKREILYHITYAVTTGEFSGYMKDFNERFKKSNGEELYLKYTDVLAHGKGMILAPESLNIHVGSFDALISNGNTIKIDIKDLVSSSNFETDTTYVTSLKLKSLLFEVKERYTTVSDVKLEKLLAYFKSDTQDKDAKIFANGNIDTLFVQNNEKKLELKKLEYEFDLEGLKKQSYIVLKKLFDQLQERSLKDVNLIQQEVLNIIAYGFDLKVKHLSLADLSFQKYNNLGGFSINLLLHVNKDNDFMNKIKKDPTVLTQNITLHTDMVFDKEFYTFLNQKYPLENILGSYKKVEGGKIIFDIDYIDQEFYINKQKYSH